MALWTIRAVALVAFMDLFMQLPVVATYARSLGAPAAMIGATVGMYSATNLLGNLGAGVLLDRMDRKRLVIIGMILTAASLYAYSFVETPAQLLVLRRPTACSRASWRPERLRCWEIVREASESDPWG